MVKLKAEAIRIILDIVAARHGPPQEMTMDELIDRLVAREFKTHDEAFLAIGELCREPGAWPK